MVKKAKQVLENSRNLLNCGTITFIVVFLIAMFLGTVSSAQDALGYSCDLPWNVETYKACILMRVKYGLSMFDEYCVSPDDSGNLTGTSPLLDYDRLDSNGYYGHPEPCGTDINASVLIWQRLRVAGLIRCAAVSLAEYHDTTNQPSWALVAMVSGDTGTHHWFVARCGDRPLKRYSHRPSNIDVYAFLDSLRAIETRMFIYDESGHYDWEGVDVRFLEGGVCEENWERSIGEKPTKFLPGKR